MQCFPNYFPVEEVIIWSSAEFVGLLAFKEMNSLSLLMLITTSCYIFYIKWTWFRPRAHLKVKSYSVSVVGGIAFQHIPVGLGYICPKTENSSSSPNKRVHCMFEKRATGVHPASASPRPKGEAQGSSAVVPEHQLDCQGWAAASW